MLKRLCFGLLCMLAAIIVIGGVATSHSYVTTPSMYPTIPPGSELFFSKESTYKVGDIIEFRGNGLTWAHRLIQIKADGSYVTKGDNPQNSPDVFVPAITKADVMGKVVAAPRWIGFPELILRHPSYGLAWLRAELGFPLRIAVVALAAILGFGTTVRRTKHTPLHAAPSD